MKIEINKTYKDAAGYKVRVMENDGHGDYPFNGFVYDKQSQICCYNLKGMSNRGGDRDLIEEWREPAISECWVSVFVDSLGEVCASLKDAQRIVSGETIHITYNHDTHTANVEVVGK